MQSNVKTPVLTRIPAANVTVAVSGGYQDGAGDEDIMQEVFNPMNRDGDRSDLAIGLTTVVTDNVTIVTAVPKEDQRRLQMRKMMRMKASGMSPDNASLPGSSEDRSFDKDSAIQQSMSVSVQLDPENAAKEKERER